MRYYLMALFVTTIFILPWFAVNYPVQLNGFSDSFIESLNDLAAVVMHNPKTIAGLQSTYNSTVTTGPSKIRILVVPGHEPNFGGAEYGSLKEREMTVELTGYLREFLEQDHHYQVFTTRDVNSWTSTFSDYYKNSWDSIVEWQKAHKDEITELKQVGKYVSSKPLVIHNSAPRDVALRLYGIGKWSNENNVDIMLHVHFNDYPRKNHTAPGTYSGITIYVPEKNFYNSTTTEALAQTVFKRLSKYNPVSNLPGENGGIVPDEDLIAVGTNNSVDAASMLIEYGYIYEPQFTNPELRSMALKDLAYQTYLGLQDFFDPTNAIKLSNSYDTLLLPHTWNASSVDTGSYSEIYKLQTALVTGGHYPPTSSNMNDCPRTGKVGPCTRSAIETYKKNRGINESGLGEKTINALNAEFGTARN